MTMGDVAVLAREMIASRRNFTPRRLVKPGPSAAELSALPEAAAAAPDHGRAIQSKPPQVLAKYRRKDGGRVRDRQRTLSLAAFQRPAESGTRRSAIGDFIIARAVYFGKTQAVCRCDVFVVKDGRQRLCAVAQGTIALLGGQDRVLG